jgi:hypothetical protein
VLGLGAAEGPFDPGARRDDALERFGQHAESYRPRAAQVNASDACPLPPVR